MQVSKFCLGVALTLENLAKRRAEVDTHCVLCYTDFECKRHALLECSYARLVWELLNVLWRLVSDWPGSAVNWLLQCAECVEQQVMPVALHSLLAPVAESEQEINEGARSRATTVLACEVLKRSCGYEDVESNLKVFG
ncbi:hypothetical protein Salat_1652500 [Sesamum alatum]|uniref:Reverse transcriptase zinc-binding domain-containing protein n=1 Tax=Sesamum alatum TaxID=300844 RepID=A0AAE1Y6Q6_9LAMI|nr:hypothetical protein Salat_1652500 [Sesamum alatum]